MPSYAVVHASADPSKWSLCNLLRTNFESLTMAHIQLCTGRTDAWCSDISIVAKEAFCIYTPVYAIPEVPEAPQLTLLYKNSEVEQHTECFQYATIKG